MKKTIILVITLISITSFAQTENLVDLPVIKERYTAHNKGKFFIFWGGNRESYSKSDIHFAGDNHDFTLYNVESQDKPKGYHLDYINPSRMTIPQTNFRIGYYINDKYNITIGFDHMKYVMMQDKVVDYSGYYPNEGTYGESLPGDQLLLTKDFLEYEHTDGLNYVNTELSRVDDISKVFNLPNTDKFQINLTEGIGGGFIYPKTNATMFKEERHDKFNIAGYGISAKAGLNLTFFKYFFIQTELKAGYIDMNNIKTSANPTYKAEQNFWFIQSIVAIGGIFRL